MTFQALNLFVFQSTAELVGMVGLWSVAAYYFFF
jgi:hypothetical protein